MPFAGYDDFDACVAANGDKDDPEAYCAAIKRQIEGADALTDTDREAIQASDEYSNNLLAEDPCWEGYTMVGTKPNGDPRCVPDDDVPDANLAAADDRCEEGHVEINGACVPVESTDAPANLLAEFAEGDAVTWDWQGATVHGRVTEVREDGDEVEYVIDEYDDAEGGYQSGNVTKSEESLDESPRDLPDRTEENMLSVPRVMASASPLDTQPIEREELEGDKVAYRGLKLIDSGVWTDSGSETATLYDDRTFQNTRPDSPSEYDGPPVNIAHDLHKSGPNKGEPHEASVGGYIDPDSLETDGEALFGDVILNTDDPAGAFADENLKSALENDGSAGFSPSVELMPTELESADHPRAEEYVAAAELTGLGLVRDPASKSVDLAQETRNRSVALSASNGQTVKTLHRQPTGMSEDRELDADEVRETLDMFGFDGLDEMTDDEVMDMAEDLHEDLMGNLEEERENETHDGEDDEEDDEPEEEMAEGQDAEEMLEGRVQDLMSRVEELEDAMASAMSQSEAEEQLSAATAELEDAKSELSALQEENEELGERVRTLEEKGEDPKTLTDNNDGPEMRVY